MRQHAFNASDNPNKFPRREQTEALYKDALVEGASKCTKILPKYYYFTKTLLLLNYFSLQKTFIGI